MTPKLELLEHVFFCENCKVLVERVCVSAGGSWPNGCYDEPVYKYVIAPDEEWHYCDVGIVLWDKVYEPL